MARTGRRREWGPVRALRPIPGAREKGAGKSEPPRPYREPTQVPLGEKPKAYGGYRGQGTRQISPVTSGEGVPAVLGVSLEPQVAVTRGA